MKHKYAEKYFLGNWNDGKPVGNGIYYDPTTILYEGGFENGEFNGEATVNLLKRSIAYTG